MATIRLFKLQTIYIVHNWNKPGCFLWLHSKSFFLLRKKTHSFVSGCPIVQWLVCGQSVVSIGWCLEDSNLRCSYSCFNAMKGAKWEQCVGAAEEDMEASVRAANWVLGVSTLSSWPWLWNQKQRQVPSEKEVWGRTMSKHRMYMKSKTAAAYLSSQCVSTVEAVHKSMLCHCTELIRIHLWNKTDQPASCFLIRPCSDGTSLPEMRER